MKKIVATLIIITSLLFVSSCKNEIDLSMYLSQNRTSVYTATNENYSVTLYGEEREDPFLSDGFVGTIKKFVTVRIEECKKSLDDASVTLSYDGVTLKGNFEYSPLSGKYITEFEVESLPSKNEISLVIKNGGEELNLTLSGYNLSGANYKSALQTVSKTASDYLGKLKSNGSYLMEVRLRTIYQQDRIYYYVSIIDKQGKTLAYLVDGESFEILASKTI